MSHWTRLIATPEPAVSARQVRRWPDVIDGADHVARTTGGG